ncbi:MAG: putative photosynthetic complex assembly protein PuhE [Pseudomonadota bacterium]
MFASPWIAALVALLLWWASTGVILRAVRRADYEGGRARFWVVVMNLPLLILGAAAFLDTLANPSVPSVYVAFFAALALWGWVELTFLTGIITGPNRAERRDGSSEWQRFRQAWGTVAYHELLLTAAFVTMIYLAHDAANPFGLYTFALLFCARISAKLNIYLGVRKINVEFLPEPLGHLPSHFRVARMNWLFPISITGLSFAAAFWFSALLAAQTSGAAVGFALLTALTMLALIEHWFMVLPLPDERLWRWMLPERPKHSQARLQSEDSK